jgi:hypothetical protein
MAIQWQIPKLSRFLQAANRFTATFNVPTLARYDFGIPANARQLVIPTQGNTVYMVERINFGATAGEGDYLAAIDPTDSPILILSQAINPQRIYRYPIPLVNYIDNQETSAWFFSDKSGDSIQITMTGKLSQTPALVGVPAIVAAVSLNIYEITNLQWVEKFRSGTIDSGAELLK